MLSDTRLTTNELKQQDFISSGVNTLFLPSLKKELFDLMQASVKQSQDTISGGNLFRKIGFDGPNARLGWVIPPAWQDIERTLNEFSSLSMVRGKSHVIFSGMGGSINAIKTLIQIREDQSWMKLYTINSLDPSALSELLNSVDELSKTLVIGISKSGTTNETHCLIQTLRERYRVQKLDYRKHFLWLTDLPQGKRRIKEMDWRSVEFLPIKVDRGTDIGGRFAAPHTALFLIPLFLLLNKDNDRLKNLWREYRDLRGKHIFESAKKAYELANKNTQRFAIVLDEKLVLPLETWVIQLFQESLGSKIAGFNPKTKVVSQAIPKGFEVIRFERASSNVVVDAMLTMYLLQVFVATFAYYKRIPFVTQPEVEIYKRKRNTVAIQKVPLVERVNISTLIEKMRRLLFDQPDIEFVEVICYWHLKDEQRSRLQSLLTFKIPETKTLVYEGSNWNHHSYQAASWNDNTLFFILTKDDYAQAIRGISPQTIQNNIDTLKINAYTTYKTLEHKARRFKLIGASLEAD